MSDHNIETIVKQKNTLSKKEIALSILGLAIVIGLLVLAFAFRKNLAAINQISQYSLIGVFIISLIASSLISITAVPIYYLLVVFTLPGMLVDSWGLFAPIWVGTVAAAGATLGQIPTYLVAYGSGRLSEKLLSRVSKRAYEIASTWATKYGGVAVFLISMIPNPLNLPATIAIATTRYSPFRWVIFALVGNLVKCLVIAIAGYFGVDFILHLIKLT